MSREKQFEYITDLLIDYDEMGFAPTTLVPNPEAHAIEWRNKLTNALQDYRKQEWISVDERLPDTGDSYLVVVKLKYAWETEWEYHVDVAGFTFCDDGYIDNLWNTFNDWCEGQECHVTHWMPLPEAPKMKGGAE